MPNESGNAYGLTTVCPLLGAREYWRKQPTGPSRLDSPATLLKDLLNALPIGEASPLAAVPHTDLWRFCVLDDVVYEGCPAASEHLASKYLVFVADIHGERDPYLQGMWKHAEAFARQAFQYCVDFDRVQDAAGFVAYIQRCQVETTFYFNGSNDLPLAEQLKALYLKQELSKFAAEHQGKPAAELQRAFQAFVERVRPRELAGPTWRPGATSLRTAVIGET
jgi:hypothetical protein